jgi:hypothetical protein
VLQHPNQWVVDTWVLDEAVKIGSPNYISAQTFLMLVLDRHHLALDYNNVILTQYQHAVGRCRSQPGRLPPEWLQKWIAEVIAKGNIYYHDGKVPNKHWKPLLAAPLAFDDDDETFVGVAYRTPDKLLVSEESDYSDEVKQYLSEETGIQVLTVLEAKDRISG